MAYQNIFSVKKPTFKPNNPLDAMGRSALSGQGISQPPRLSYAQPQQSKAPQMSVAPKLIQGSGYGSSYASNETNQPVRPPQPTPTPTPQPQAVDPTARYMSDTRTTANSQQQFAENARKQQEDYIKQQYALANQQLGEALPAAQNQFGQLKSNTEASITDLLAGGEKQKQQATDYYGEAQREAAKSRREVQGQTQRTFAGLGTLDSRGEGSFAQANENQDSEFNRFTQQTLKAKADKLSEIDMTVKAAERQARATITQEEAKLSELARNIQYAQANNNLQQARELTDAYNTTKQYIYEIEDKVNQMKYQFGLEQQKLDNEMKKTQTFTPEFMQTGKPTNQAEWEFLVKNKDAVSSSISSIYGGGATKSNQKVDGIIDELLNYNTQGITGKMRFGFSDESRTAAGLLKQMSSELQLEEAKRMKGQGQMTEAERAILANSIAAFNLDKNGLPNVSDERFREILEGLKTGFSGGQQGGGQVTMTSTDGQVYSVDQSEVQEAVANGWRLN